MAVDIALDGEKGLARAFVHDYDVIVLDRDLPVVHGDDVCARLVAARGRRRVLMLTGAAENEDLVEGLRLGADDYLAKPFAFAVLLARIGALARRAQPSIPPVLQHGDIVLDTARRCAIVWTEGCVEDPGLRKLSGAGVPAGLGRAAGGAVVVPF